MPTKMSIDSNATDLDRNSDNNPEPSSSNDPQGTGTPSPDPSSGLAGVGEQVSPAGRKTDPGISTQSVHAGERRQKPEGSISAPIFTASTYTFESTDSLLRFVDGLEVRDEYGRYGTPNERTCEAKLAALEGAEEAIIYSSGMAAIVGLLMSRLSAGDEIVFFDQCYHRSREFCAKHLARFGVVTRQVPTGDFEAMEAAITSNTKMLVSESPTNPHLTAVDLEKFVALESPLKWKR